MEAGFKTGGEKAFPRPVRTCLAVQRHAAFASGAGMVDAPDRPFVLEKIERIIGSGEVPLDAVLQTDRQR